MRTSQGGSIIWKFLSTFQSNLEKILHTTPLVFSNLTYPMANKTMLTHALDESPSTTIGIKFQ